MKRLSQRLIAGAVAVVALTGVVVAVPAAAQAAPLVVVNSYDGGSSQWMCTGVLAAQTVTLRSRGFVIVGTECVKPQFAARWLAKVSYYRP
jgi:hypothetical protein